MTLFQRSQRGRDFCHLHERQHAFLHTCPARSGEDDHGAALLYRAFDQTRDFLAHRRAHRAADEQHVHRAGKDFVAADFAARGDDCFRQTRGVLRLLDSLPIGLTIDKLQRVGRNHFRIQLFAVSVVEDLLQPIVGADAKVIVAMHANLEGVFQFFLVKVLSALLATHKDIFRAYHAL